MTKPQLGVTDNGQQRAQSVDDVINTLEAQQIHPTRQLARGLVAEYRKGTAIDAGYDFSAQPRELRQVVYDAAVRFHCKKRWRLFR